MIIVMRCYLLGVCNAQTSIFASFGAVEIKSAFVVFCIDEDMTG